MHVFSLPRLICRLCLILLLAPCLLLARPAWALTPVTLQLKWTHTFQFAGYYAAQIRGYYREAGLDVTLREAQPGDDPLRAVLSGRAEFGVGTSSLLLARHRGAPVVVLAVIFQHSPLVLLSKSGGPSAGIHDLLDKRVMLEPQSDELLAYLQQEGISSRRITWLAHSYRPTALLDSGVDAVSAYSINEPYYLDQAGLQYQTFTPRSAGIDFYGDNLFTREALLNDSPEMVRAFRTASLRGWQYAMAHPEEIIQWLVNTYPGRHPADFHRHEARRMAPLLRTDLVEVGYMNPGRWRHIADTYAELGLLPSQFSLKGFLYQTKPAIDWLWLGGALAVTAMIGGVALYIHRINRQLTRALATSQATLNALYASEARLRELNARDALTGLANRERLFEQLDTLLGAPQAQLAVLFIDLDGFKAINDQFGHAAGDQLLRVMAERMRASLPARALLARLGGAMSLWPYYPRPRTRPNTPSSCWPRWPPHCPPVTAPCRPASAWPVRQPTATTRKPWCNTPIWPCMPPSAMAAISCNAGRWPPWPGTEPHALPLPRQSGRRMLSALLPDCVPPMKNIADIRKDYASQTLDPDDCLAHPVAQFSRWLDDAIAADVPEPTAMLVSTVSPEGRPAARVVLLKGVEDNQLVFYTNYHSRKGQHLGHTPFIALTFFWPELERQVNIEGVVNRVADETSDAYFDSRPYKSRVGAWASEQSQPISGKEVVMARFARFAAQYLTHVPRPPHWGGFAVTPERMEFWQGRPSRLHDRVLYLPDGQGGWQKQRLAP